MINKRSILIFIVVLVFLLGFTTISIFENIDRKNNILSEDVIVKLADKWASALNEQDRDNRYNLLSEDMKIRFQNELDNNTGVGELFFDDQNRDITNFGRAMIIDDEVVEIEYKIEDSTLNNYSVNETLYFGIEDGKCVIINYEVEIGNWQIYNVYATNIDEVINLYIEAYMQGDYLKLLSLYHDNQFLNNGQELMDQLSVSDIRVVDKTITEDSALIELEIEQDIPDTGEISIRNSFIKLEKNEKGWYIIKDINILTN